MMPNNCGYALKIYELLDSPDKWTKDCTARDIKGDCVTPTDINATCWCLLGAVHKVYGDAYAKRVENLIWNYLDGAISEFNDDPTTTYEDIIKLVKELDV